MEEDMEERGKKEDEQDEDIMGFRRRRRIAIRIKREGGRGEEHTGLRTKEDEKKGRAIA